MPQTSNPQTSNNKDFMYAVVLDTERLILRSGDPDVMRPIADVI